MATYFNPRGAWNNWHTLKALDHRVVNIYGNGRRRRSIPGPILCGFSELFEKHYGDDATPEPLATITPSFVGNSLLPFRCPRCKRPAQELACPETREKYHDKREGRNNYWCPSCGYRFKIDLRGTPLASPLKAGAVVGPSKIERNGTTTWQDKPGILAALLGAGSYEFLAR